MTAFDFIGEKVRTFTSISDPSVTVHLTEGETGSDSDPVICIEFILRNGCYHIGSQAVSRYLGEGLDRTQKITIAARETTNFDATLLARAFETAAEWLRDYAKPAHEHDCFYTTDGPSKHQAYVQELLKLPPSKFSETEYGFVRSLADRHYPLTEKQQRWLDAIVNRIVG